MMVGPNGERFRPSLGWRHIQRLAPVVQGQFVQHTVERLEGKLVVRRPLTDEEVESLREHLSTRMPNIREIAITYVDDVPRSASGKFEDFISVVNGPASSPEGMKLLHDVRPISVPTIPGRIAGRS